MYVFSCEVLTTVLPSGTQWRARDNSGNQVCASGERCSSSCLIYVFSCEVLKPTGTQWRARYNSRNQVCASGERGSSSCLIYVFSCEVLKTGLGGNQVCASSERCSSSSFMYVFSCEVPGALSWPQNLDPPLVQVHVVASIFKNMSIRVLRSKGVNAQTISKQVVTAQGNV
jgi:hypothetical protein